MIKRFFFYVIIIFCFSLGFSQEKKELTKVIIEKALETHYTKDKDTDEDLIQFSGDVTVSVIQPDRKIILNADLINYNRKRNILYAYGSILLKQYSGSTATETLTANSVIFNTDTFEAIFDDGRIVQEQQETINISNGAKLSVGSELFARDRSESVTFKNGMLSFSDSDEPYWKIRASRIWLLPGNEFAFANGLLYVGVVPVMYFPFFYYPKDELVFNPVFGYRPREGYYVQTTTYLIGRKKLEQKSKTDTGFNFMHQTRLKEQKQEGLILRNLKNDAKAPVDYVKLIGDYYSTLGPLFGATGEFKNKGIVKSLFFDTRIGISTVLFPIKGSNQYLSYGPQKKKYPDYGWLFGKQVPFRFLSFIKMELGVKNFSLNFSMPLYSDPWFNYDFGDRKETMDWIDFFLSGTLNKGSQQNVSETEKSKKGLISNFTWDLNISYSPNLAFLKPYINTIRIKSFISSLTFEEQTLAQASPLYIHGVTPNSPNRRFFFPSQIKPFILNTEINGTLVSIPSTKQNTTTSTNETVKDMIIPKSLEKKETTPQKNTQSQGLFDSSTLPALEGKKIEIKSIKNLSYNLNYTLNPSINSLLTYKDLANSQNRIDPLHFSLKNPDYFDIELKSPLKLQSNLAIKQNMMSLSNSINFNPTYKKHPYISPLYTSAERDRLLLNDYYARKINITNANTFSLKPFVFIPMFENTALNWNTNITLLQSQFIGTVQNPQWEYKGPDTTKKTITSHNINFIFDSKTGILTETFSLQANLPPLVESYSGEFTLKHQYASFSLKTAYNRESEKSSKWFFTPLHQNFQISFFSKTKDGKNNPHKITLNEYYEYNIDKKYSANFSLSATWQGLSVKYTMKHSPQYQLDTAQGWVPTKEEKLVPQYFLLSYSTPEKKFQNKKETISFGFTLNTSLNWDLLIPTNSSFDFQPTLTFKIKDILTLTFSARSQNQELIRYFQKPLKFGATIPGEQNIFLDLFNSFAFWDKSKRISSGFKIKSFHIKIEHDLVDWTLSSEFKIEPRVEAGSKKFDYRPFFTLSILWKPMSGIKTVIEDKYGTFTLNP